VTPFLNDVTFEYRAPMGFNPLRILLTKQRSCQSSPDCSGILFV